jgi:hypothetical protein
MGFLHVANGTCTTSIIREAGIPGLRSLWADLLNEGPVPGGLTDEELIAVRERFRSDPTRIADEHENSSSHIDRHEFTAEVILWFEHDLFDQLNLIQLLTWIRGAFRPRNGQPICIGSFPGRPAFKGRASSRRRIGVARGRAARQRGAVRSRRAWSAFAPRAGRPRPAVAQLTLRFGRASPVSRGIPW